MAEKAEGLSKVFESEFSRHSIPGRPNMMSEAFSVPFDRNPTEILVLSAAIEFNSAN
jgi:hypothetical protein